MESPVSALARDRRIADALLEISYAVGSVMEIGDILAAICGITARTIGTDTCSIYLLDGEEDHHLILRATHGLMWDPAGKPRWFENGQGIPGWAVQANQTVTVSDALSDSRYSPLDDTPEEQRFLSYLCTPLRIQDEVIGVMSLRRERYAEWTPEEAVFAEIIAKQVAIVLEKARLYWEKVEAERLAAVAISLSEVAHYIKNVLQGMTGGAGLVESGLAQKDVEKVQVGWGLLKKSSNKISKLVQNMLNFARQTELEMQIGDFNAHLAETVESFRETAEQRKIVVKLDLDESVPPVAFDETALHDAVLNLVTNAADAIPENREGLIVIQTKADREKSRVRLRVTDNGQGIPPEQRAKVFNLFYSTKGHAGTGIGLAVTRKIINEHGGTIWFESELGVGTQFVIELPFPPAPA